MNKINIQHNMFIELFPQQWFKYEGINPKIVKKTDIKECYIEHFREECRWNDRDREPIHIITVVMNDGAKHQEWYSNLTAYGDYGMDDVKNIAGKRYEFIKQQLCEL